MLDSIKYGDSLITILPMYKYSMICTAVNIAKVGMLQVRAGCAEQVPP
jgi:hypothetical protein